MTQPANSVSTNGVGAVSDAQLNAYVQFCPTVALARGFVGIAGMTMTLQGYSVPNDGGWGEFYWNATSTAADDGGVKVIRPNGVTVGAWLRLSGLTGIFGGGVTSITAGVGVDIDGVKHATLTSTGTINLDPATTAALGGIIAGSGTTIDIDGTLSVPPGGVTAVTSGTGLEVGSTPGGTITTTGTLNLLPATTAALGGIVAGANTTINVGGTLSVANPSPAGVTAVTAGRGLEVGSTPGGTITAAGTLNLLPATTAALGGVISGSGTTIDGGGTLAVSTKYTWGTVSLGDLIGPDTVTFTLNQDLAAHITNATFTNGGTSAGGTLVAVVEVVFSGTSQVVGGMGNITIDNTHTSATSSSANVVPSGGTVVVNFTTLTGSLGPNAAFTLSGTIDWP